MNMDDFMPKWLNGAELQRLGGRYTSVVARVVAEHVGGRQIEFDYRPFPAAAGTGMKVGERDRKFVERFIERAQNDPAVWTREDRQRFWKAVASGAPGYAKASFKAVTML